MGINLNQRRTVLQMAEGHIVLLDCV